MLFALKSSEIKSKSKINAQKSNRNFYKAALPMSHPALQTFLSNQILSRMRMSHPRNLLPGNKSYFLIFDVLI